MFVNYDVNFNANVRYKKYLEKTIKQLETNGVAFVESQEHINDIKSMLNYKFNFKVTKSGLYYRLVKEE